ncbi:MAG: aromatic-ring-hydroxylating dioxygenase subunit beta, partial [Polaromonas sp.]|nr:aromatic-ring-hydroxylating dioxygenase subunit beta [Polaromonas sp.]
MEQVIERPAAAPAIAATRIPVGSEKYNRIVEFLYDEAQLLDDLKLREWSALLAEDLT